jgi:hypothetical protein
MKDSNIWERSKIISHKESINNFNTTTKEIKKTSYQNNLAKKMSDELLSLNLG